MSKRFFAVWIVAIVACWFWQCTNTNASVHQKVDSIEVVVKDSVRVDPCAVFLDTLLCDGFDFPFGDSDGGGSYTDATGKTYSGWYIATHTGEAYSLGVHTGEDWNGNGGGNTDLGQGVHAVARGRVVAAENYGAPWGNVILIEHHLLENGLPKTVYSLYAHLEKVSTKKGAVVNRRESIGTIGTGDGAYPAHLHLEIRKADLASYDVTYWPSDHGKDSKWVLEHYEQPSAFIHAHKSIVVPHQSQQILIALKSKYRMYLYASGKLEKIYTIGLGQEPIGAKQKQGDNKTPEGEYAIIQKARGPFEGAYGAYLGVAWMRINYPNNFDAAQGLSRKSITRVQYDAIVKANTLGKEPLKTTALGGGIGIHGWAGNWPGNDRQNLTWGCISVQNTDLDDLYKRVEVGTRIIIHP